MVRERGSPMPRERGSPMPGIEFLTFSGNLRPVEEVCIPDMEYFIKNLSVIKGEEVRPELIGLIIMHYAAKWLPELGGCEAAIAGPEESPESMTASWTKKRFLVESIIAILPPPPEEETVSCDFLLRLLRVACMVQAEPAHRAELERRISWRLDQASLKEMMIPCFSHTAATLLDVNLIVRLTRSWFAVDREEAAAVAAMKVAKLVDSYLAETAVDTFLTSSEFIELASTIPSHARITDDGLYRAIDTYLKAHPGLGKEERRTVCGVLDVRKLSAEASVHAAWNERLPVRTVVQVVVSEQGRWLSPTLGLEVPGRCLSKREVGQEAEMRRLRQDVARLQGQCAAMEKLLTAGERKRYYNFSWKRLGIPVFRGGGRDNHAPTEMKASFLRGKSSNKRQSLS